MLGTIACYRALLVAILTRAYARAYGHAAEYLLALRRADGQVDDYRSLPTHEAFESSLRSTHGRKVSFGSGLATGERLCPLARLLDGCATRVDEPRSAVLEATKARVYSTIRRWVTPVGSFSPLGFPAGS